MFAYKPTVMTIMLGMNDGSIARSMNIFRYLRQGLPAHH